MTTLTHGYDVSAYQGNTVAKAAFGWVKTSEGDSYKNSKFKAQWESALANWDAPGVYHYAHPEESSATQQVGLVASMVDLVAGKHTVMLDLEASKLTQKKTNDWAKTFSDACRSKFDGVTTVLYMGGGYATNGTGKGLKDFFDLWMYPQYPSIYRASVLEDFPDHIQTLDDARAMNRSAYHEQRYLLSAPKSTWPPAMTPWLPDGAEENTGWLDGPDVWQFSDNHSPGGIDASVSSRTVAQFLGSGVTPQEAIEVYGGTVLPGEYEDMSYPHGKIKAIGIYCSSDQEVTGTIEVNHKTAQTTEKTTFKVGGKRLAKGGVKKYVYMLKTPADGDAMTITNNGPAKIGWDAS